jgi:hypothetical protein
MKAQKTQRVQAAEGGLGVSVIPGNKAAYGEERRKAHDWNRPQGDQLTAQEICLLDAVLELLPEGEESITVLLDGEPGTVPMLCSLQAKGFIRFAPPVSLGMAAIIARPLPLAGG